MASHHHHDGGCRHRHHNHHETIDFAPANYATSSPCCCGDSRLCCTQSNHSSPPSLDHLLRLIASYLQNQQQDTQCSCEVPSQRFNGVRRQSFVNHPHQKKTVQRECDNLILSCLLRKIEHLDLSLNRRDLNPTLRDSAARVIQSHFRSYLVRRSISLRQLKELATIKSSFFSLKSSVSGKTHFPFDAVSREATDLLLLLDSIQGRVDPMIRDGKRLLSRDLVRFLQYIDACAVKRRDIVCKSAKDRRFREEPHVGEDRVSEKSRKQKMGTIYVTTNGDDEESIAELEEFHFMTDDGQEIPIVSVENSRKIGSSKSRVGTLVKGNKVKTPDKNRKNVYELTSSVEDDSFDDTISCDDGSSSNSRTRSRSGVVIKGSPAKARVLKTVSFDEDGNVYKVYGDTPEASVSGENESSTSGSNNENGDDYNEVEDIKYVPKENKGFEEEEVHSENEEESFSEEAQVIENVTHPGINEQHKREFQRQKGSSMFSPPLPLKMEP